MISIGNVLKVFTPIMLTLCRLGDKDIRNVFIAILKDSTQCFRKNKSDCDGKTLT